MYNMVGKMTDPIDWLFRIYSPSLSIKPLVWIFLQCLVIPVTQTDDILSSADQTNAHQSVTDGVLYRASVQWRS